MSEKTPSLQEIAYERIRQDIIYCRLTPGQKISIRSLEERLEVGRTPIREALVMLGQQDLVYTVPQSGTYVSRIRLQNAENSRFVREHLEASVAVECSARISAEGCRELQQLLDLQQQAVDARDAATFFALDNRFHETLFAIAGRHDIWRWIDASNTNLDRFRWLRTQVSGLDWDVIMKQHRQLYRALAEHNTEEVSYLTTAHLHLMTAEQAAVLSAFPDFFED